MHLSGRTIAQPVSLYLTSVAAALTACGGDAALRWLGEEETRRYQSITAAGRRQQFLAGRYWVRRALAAQAGGDWRDYVLSAPADGAPVVLACSCQATMARTRLHFSLSHSRDLLVCAVSSQVVGVDIEDTAVDRDFERLGAWIYGAHETAMLANQCQSARRAGFYALWALKEAWLKCWGTHYPMCLVQFAPCAARDAQAVVLADPRWTLALVGRAQVSTMACSPELNDAALAWWRIVDVPFGA